jgi:hypothetical protein
MSREGRPHIGLRTTLLTVAVLVGVSACSTSSSNIQGSYTGTVVDKGVGYHADVTAQLHCPSSTSCVFSGSEKDGRTVTPFSVTLSRQGNVLSASKGSPGTSTDCATDASTSIVGITIRGKGLYMVQQDQSVDTSDCTAHQLVTTMHLTRTTNS